MSSFRTSCGQVAPFTFEVSKNCLGDAGASMLDAMFCKRPRLMCDYHVPHQVKCAISPQTLTKLSSVNGEKFIKVAEVQGSEIKPFVDSLSKCPKPT
ncbi:hypothetical protein VPH35_073815 [Triticum aestivum]